jgi:hypothetical protein
VPKHGFGTAKERIKFPFQGASQARASRKGIKGEGDGMEVFFLSDPQAGSTAKDK